MKQGKSTSFRHESSRVHKRAEKKLETVRKEKEAAVASQEFEKAAALRDEERKLSEELEEKEKLGKPRTRKRSQSSMKRI